MPGTPENSAGTPGTQDQKPPSDQAPPSDTALGAPEASGRVGSSAKPTGWYVFRGLRGEAGAAHTPPETITLPEPPPWRNFRSSQGHKGTTFRVKDEAIQLVNAALYLRRPLLITGLPGTGKSSLAYAVAAELGLGDVLVWPITSRSQLKDGLYSYDAIGRLQASNLARSRQGDNAPASPIGEFLRLGPLGTALADSRPGRPRVLLIDEIDKSDIDLPNDLLNTFEDGEFYIPELARLAEGGDKTEPDEAQARPKRKPEPVEVRMHRARRPGDSDRIAIERGHVRCQEFPFVILTSNGERALPAPLLRRCLRLEINPPDETELKEIVRAHFNLAEGELPSQVVKYIEKIVDRRKNKKEYVATDQLLNVVYLVLLKNVELAGSPADTRADAEQLAKQLEDFILETISTSL